MLSLVMNLLVALALIVWGMLVLYEHPCTKGFLDWVQDSAQWLAKGDYHVPFYVVALAFLLVGGFALFNAVMMVAAGQAFWL